MDLFNEFKTWLESKHGYENVVKYQILLIREILIHQTSSWCVSFCQALVLTCDVKRTNYLYTMLYS
jgi:hypothetical protein